jgi:Xaa-Pro aminopeptidase
MSYRQIKKSWEIRAIEKSIKKTHKAFKNIEKILKDSRIKNSKVIYNNKPLTSEFLRKESQKILEKEGMLNKEGIIISSGKYSAKPHHPGKGTIYAHQPIVCDIYPVSAESKYFADTSRTYIKGVPNIKVKKMYETVLRAQNRALKMVKPGARTADIHEAVCKIFIDNGFDVGNKKKGFVHSTGHGIGRHVHELPHVNKISKTILKPGHVITIEPGLYYPELGGIRIEDVVVVTKRGSKNLTRYPKKFLIP